ncbi:hypothetical protein SCALM49S_03918 [Streptomyces californicus]
MLDALWVLYDRVLRVTPDAVDDPGGTGSCSPRATDLADYAVLAAHGFFDESLLPGFGSYHSPLGHHPDRLLVPGGEIGSGSLGHGLPIAVGTVLGLRAQGVDRSPGMGPDRRRGAGRGQQPRGHRPRRPRPGSNSCTRW